MENIELTQSERSTYLWKRLLKHMQDLLDKERRQNDQDDTPLDPDATKRRRGSIRTLKMLIALDTPTTHKEE